MAVIARDTFTRADNPVLGNCSDTGQAWQYSGATTLGIHSNQSWITHTQSPPQGRNRAYIEAGISDNCFVKLQLNGTIPVNTGVCGRLAPDGSCFILMFNGSQLVLYKWTVAGGFEYQAAGNSSFPSGSYLKMTFTGTQIDCSVIVGGGEHWICGAHSSFNQSQTKFGIWQNWDLINDDRFLVDNFSVESPAVVPTVTSCTPGSGITTGGTAITNLSGMNFTGTTVVTFGGVAATSIVVVSDILITCVTPAHAAGTVDIAVTNLAGTGTLTNGYTYVNYVPSGVVPLAAGDVELVPIFTGFTNNINSSDIGALSSVECSDMTKPGNLITLEKLTTDGSDGTQTGNTGKWFVGVSMQEMVKKILVYAGYDKNPDDGTVPFQDIDGAFLSSVSGNKTFSTIGRPNQMIPRSTAFLDAGGVRTFYVGTVGGTLLKTNDLLTFTPVFISTNGLDILMIFIHPTNGLIYLFEGGSEIIRKVEAVNITTGALVQNYSLPYASGYRRSYNGQYFSPSSNSIYLARYGDSGYYLAKLTLSGAGIASISETISLAYSPAGMGAWTTNPNDGRSLNIAVYDDGVTKRIYFGGFGWASPASVPTILSYMGYYDIVAGTTTFFDAYSDMFGIFNLFPAQAILSNIVLTDVNLGLYAVYITYYVEYSGPGGTSNINQQTGYWVFEGGFTVHGGSTFGTFTPALDWQDNQPPYMTSSVVAGGGATLTFIEGPNGELYQIYSSIYLAVVKLGIPPPENNMAGNLLWCPSVPANNLIERIVGVSGNTQDMLWQYSLYINVPAINDPITSMANFGNDTVFSALRNMTEAVGFVSYFNEEGKYFFKARPSLFGTAALNFKENEIMEMEETQGDATAYPIINQENVDVNGGLYPQVYLDAITNMPVIETGRYAQNISNDWITNVEQALAIGKFYVTTFDYFKDIMTVNLRFYPLIKLMDIVSIVKQFFAQNSDTNFIVLKISQNHNPYGTSIMVRKNTFDDGNY